jgi:FKBP-type peptidyl-prolyl cis-trans isomerase FkpA
MEAGRNFLTANAGKEGVVTTASGLQYKIITQGTGAQPAAEDTVEVHYRGTLIDGSEFDSSYKRGKSISFPLGNVIRGWTEGVQLMPVGSKYEFYIPYELAYGPQGRPPVIPPYATLIFEVELLAIK